MGGFMVNGCGTGDSFYPKLILGNHFCKHCKSIQEFDLMEIRRKIRVFFVPTISINTKYGVACKKCKNGFYIEDALRDDLLYGRKAIEVRSGEIVYFDTKAASATDPLPSAAETARSASPQNRFCKYCGTELKEGMPFCAACGSKIE